MLLDFIKMLCPRFAISQEQSESHRIECKSDGYHVRVRNIGKIRRRKFSVGGWLRNGGFKYIFVFLWMIVNGVVFASVYFHYKFHPKYYYLREILGTTLCISRGSAALLNLNCAALLLPICRHLLARLRHSRFTRRMLRRWLDHYRFTHIMFAGCVCVATVIHCAGHSINAVNFSRRYNSLVPDVNVARYRGQNPCTMMLSTVAGITGFCMLFLLLFICITSLPCVRRGRHDVFWFSHHVFVLFYILLICHPLGGALKEQCNTETHIPGCIYLDDPLAEPMPMKNMEPTPGDWKDPLAEPSSNSTSICQERPVFISHSPRTWRFLLVPVVFYIVDRVWRWYRSRRHVIIENVRFHPGDVMELQLCLKNLKARPGQFVLLHCPAISRLEWHPFTMTSCPITPDGAFSLHLKTCGDWTESLMHLMKESLKTSNGDDGFTRIPRVYIDGPLGSASEDVLRYPVGVCIAGGIGVTPFAAILHSLSVMDEKRLLGLKICRLYFIWICREASHFQWFSDTLNSLQRKLWQLNRPDFLSLRLFVTNKSSWNEVRVSSDASICSRISSGRPDFEDIFSEVTICNSESDIGVFVCGPRKLSRKVHRLCNRFNVNKTRLHFNKESFS